MGPYYRQATAEGDKSQEKFLQVVYRQYCNRWPIDQRDFPDLDFMNAYVEAQRLVSQRHL